MKRASFSKWILVILPAVMLSSIASAQLFSRKSARTAEQPPKAILVQLPAHQRKVTALEKAKSKPGLRQIKIDTDSIIAKMVLDFKDNFNYCPVYYFIDTNADLVRDKKFDGVLLGADLKPAGNSISPDDNYFIVYFGYPIATAGDAANKDDKDITSSDVTIASGKKKLVALDKNMNMVKKPLPTGSNSLNRKAGKKPVAAYRYTSPTFDLYYRPSAKSYNLKLHEFYGKRVSG